MAKFWTKAIVFSNKICFYRKIYRQHFDSDQNSEEHKDVKWFVSYLPSSLPFQWWLDLCWVCKPNLLCSWRSASSVFESSWQSGWSDLGYLSSNRKRLRRSRKILLAETTKDDLQFLLLSTSPAYNQTRCSLIFLKNSISSKCLNKL